MTQEEKIFHCGHISIAARSLGIRIKEFKTDLVQFFYQWVDPQTNVNIRGASSQSKEDAFFNGCETLVKYLDAKSS